MPSGMGYGAAQGLEQVLARRFQEQLEKTRMAEQARAFGLQDRRLAQDASQFDRTLDLNEREGAADMALRGTIIGQNQASAEADRDFREREAATDAALAGTTIAQRAALQDDEQAFTAGQNAQDRSARSALVASQQSPPPGPSPYTAERAARVVQSVDALMSKVGMNTVGLGSVLANVPGTNARDFQAELDTLKANIAFNELTQMREASKTGGALGNVSERELDLLSSALGGLDAGQSPENLKEQLQRIRDSITRWQEAVGNASGPPMGAGVSTDAAAAGMGAPAGGVDVAAILKQYGLE